MEFDFLLEAVGDEPVFETGLLLVGEVDPNDVRRQLSRWTTSGKLIQLRRGLYCLAAPYAHAAPHPFLVANRLQAGSYVSLQSALAWYGMIPEGVPVTTSVTTGRPGSYSTPLGSFEFRRIHKGLFSGYRLVEAGTGQWAFIASPEKALLDLAYLQPGGDAPGYLRSLRLQALERLDLAALRSLACAAGKPKLVRAAEAVCRLTDEETEGYLEI